tara:strand:+ start:2517 stop:3293 length:777 start_codon:yes stop_codon:yes gene_type:complete
MDKILDQVLDLPKMINTKLPLNNFNSMVDDSDQVIAKWAGKFYIVSALVVLITTIIAVLSPIWSGGMGEGIGILENAISMLIWVYAAFPITHVIRVAGDGLAKSKSGIVDFVFRDFIVANIKVIGHVTALIALFGAFCVTLSWATSLNFSTSLATDWIDNISYAYTLPMAATVELTNALHLEFIGNILSNDWSNWDPTMSTGSAWSLNGFYSVLWEYVGVLVILAKLYVALAIYHFFYGIISSLVKWIKSPYLPFRAK